MDEGVEVRSCGEEHCYLVEEHFRDGVLVRRLRFRQGVLVSDMPFGEHGFPVGLAREWDVTGELKRERTFEAATAVTGELRTWHRSGELKERRHRSDRQWVGLHEKFYSDGSVRMVGRWDRGSRHGTWKWYYPRGRLRLEVTYEDGAPAGSVRLWRDDGALILELAVRHGVPERGWLDRVLQVEEAEFSEWEPGLTIYDADRRPVVFIMMTGVPRRARLSPLDFRDTGKPWWRFS